MRHSTTNLRPRTLRAAFAIAGAIAAVEMVSSAPAGAQAEFSISTSGATALVAFTRMNGNANAPTNATINRGPLAVGVSSLTIGATTYTLQPGITYTGIANLNAPVTGEPTTSHDRLLYYYRESGSVQGVLDLVDSNGLRAASPGTEIRPGDPAANLFLWMNGSRFNSVASGYSTGTTPNTLAGTPDTGRRNGRNYTTGVNPQPEATPNGQPLVRVAWSDVRFEQAFSVTGAANPNSTPTNSGYGLGRGNVGGTNFQQLRNSNAIVGGIAPATTRLRNEAVAVVPFNLVANPGTGLAEVTKNEGKWLQATGRLPNGANFNSVTREIGSGTRNQGNLNMALDPSWGGGERDRRATATYNTFDVNGNPITVNPGDEADPVLSLAGNTVQDINENRTGPNVRFADKISGSSGVRATVVASRMGLGILSAGDSRDATNGSALASVANTTGAPMRALRIDWDNAGPRTGTQATAANVTAGDYEMWSAAQAVTAAPYANPSANDTGANAYRPINGDTNDQNPGNPTSAAQPGVHRKFLNNITQSVSTYTAGTSSSITPADFILTSAFIPPQLMAVTKEFDGGAYTPRARSSAEEALYQQAIAAANGVLNQQTNWADPSTMNGGLGVNAVTYKLFASANTGGTPNRTIVVNARTNLAGDMNNDQVRDLADTADLALAYANADAYLATAQGTGVNSTSTGTNPNPRDGLIVLTDFNSNGNVTTNANDPTFDTAPVERADVRYFLYGATVDTSSFSTAQARRENGVRLGQLKKNQAIDTFNTTLDGFVGTVINPSTSQNYTQTEVEALKFDKFDVNNDGARNRTDAIIVDRNVGKNYTSFTDVLSTFDDLVAAELNDNNAITHVLSAGTSDFKLIRDALGTALLSGDANIDGNVNLADFNTLAANFGQSVDRWSRADFDFNGLVNLADFNLLAANFGLSAGASGPTPDDWAGLGAAVPEPGNATLMALGAVALGQRRRRRNG